MRFFGAWVESRDEANYRHGVRAEVVGLDIMTDSLAGAAARAAAGPDDVAKVGFWSPDRVCVRIRYSDTGELDWWSLDDWKAGKFDFVAGPR